MKALVIAAVALSACACFAQSDKPNVTVAKMTDAEYKRLDNASEAMQKAADAYRKAADEYAAAKSDVLGKYNALESTDCHYQKIVDVRGQYIIVETRPPLQYSAWGSLTTGCGITGGGAFVTNGTTLTTQ